MPDIGHPTPPLIFADWRAGLHTLAKVLHAILIGQTNSTGTVTLDANAASTAVTDRRVGAYTEIMFSPTTLNAAGEIGDGGFYIEAKGKSTFTIAHASNAETDRTFHYALHG